MPEDFQAIERHQKAGLRWVVDIDPYLMRVGIEGWSAPTPSKAMLYHMAASGFFTRIEIYDECHNLCLLSWGRKEMQEFVGIMNLRGHQALERELQGQDDGVRRAMKISADAKRECSCEMLPGSCTVAGHVGPQIKPMA